MPDHRKYFNTKDERLLSMKKLIILEDSCGPDTITLDEEVTVLYYGYLNSGADDLSHYGYGDAENWQQVSIVGMEKTSEDLQKG